MRVVRGLLRLLPMRLGVYAIALTMSCVRPPDMTPVPMPTLERDVAAEEQAVQAADLRGIARAARIALEMGPAADLPTRSCDASGEFAARYAQAHCYRCAFAIFEPDAALPNEAALRTLAQTLVKYPHSFLRAAQIRKIALCRKLTGEPPVAGLADPMEHRLMVSLEPNSGRPEATLHHEIFHLFDRASTPGGDSTNDLAWEGLNPRSFRYRSEPSSALEPGFINDYAKTAVAEDKASVFEYMMGYPDELCARAVDDPILMAKARLLLARIEETVAPGGSAFVTDRVPCLVR